MNNLSEPLSVVSSEKSPKRKWIAETVRMVVEQGYRVTPFYVKEDDEGKVKSRAMPYAKGQTYPDPDAHCWRDADHIGVILDDAGLLDWDGNKGGEVTPLAELQAKLMVESLDLHLVQENKERTSLHFLFRMPTGVDAEQFKQSCDGWLPNVDVKTGNQLMHLKQHKTIIGNKLPKVEELAEVPPIMLDALKARKHNSRKHNTRKHGTRKHGTSKPLPKWNGSQSEVEEARELLSYINPTCTYAPWLNVLMAIHSKFGNTETAFKLADEWSAGGNNYSGADVIRYKLGTFTADGGITFKTLAHMARESGADLKAIRDKYKPDAVTDLHNRIVSRINYSLNNFIRQWEKVQ